MSEIKKDSMQLFTDLVAISRGRKKFSLVRTVQLTLRVLLGCVFLPVFIFSSIIENRSFLKMLKVTAFVAYTAFITLCLYTFLSKNKILKNQEKVVIELDYRDKMKEFK
ncbi:MAG: hypothetical protein LBI29_01915 [Rickettsiales bacterium]|jgi:amino acid permease|nr:hypothetical protein [Rickettsiales bacterium]